MELASQAFPIAAMIALALGALSFLSPCVLPIVPAYLAFMSGSSISEARAGMDRRRIIITALYFVLGLSTVFMILALAVNRMASLFLGNQHIFNMISGAIIVIFGLHFLGVFRIGFLQRELRLDGGKNNSHLGAYVLGLAFAFGWSPCLGPALSAILSMVANQSTLGTGLALMAFYAAGLGLPFIGAAVLMDRFMNMGQFLKSKMGTIEKIMGTLLIIIGVMMFTGSFTDLANWLNNELPFLQKFG